MGDETGISDEKMVDWRALKRDRPIHWNVIGALFPNSSYGVGNEWLRSTEVEPRPEFDTDGKTLVCEECGSTNAMIVNDPFDPEESVDTDSPTQVICSDCTEGSLPEDSDY